MERRSELVLLDDGLARRHAELLGLGITGTLGIPRAKRDGHVPLVLPLLGRLDALGFRLAVPTRTAVLKLAGE